MDAIRHIIIPRLVYLPCILIIFVYFLCILAVDPRGEFPLNDDWSYSRSAFAFGTGQGLKVDEWSAPSLLGQALYGGLLAKLFSPSFYILRLSTLILSGITAFLLWATFLQIGLRKDFICFLLLAWIFNPLQFCLSFTYMTEIPFLFFISLSIFLYVLFLNTEKLLFLFLSAAGLGYAFLIRQTALLFIFALICSLIFDSRTSAVDRVRRSIITAATSAAFIFCYFLWTSQRGGETAAIRRKFQLLNYLTSEQIISNTFGILFYLAFMLLPICFILLPALGRAVRKIDTKIQIAALTAWPLLSIGGVCWFWIRYHSVEYLPSKAYHARMPFLLNVLYDTGIGPITLNPSYSGTPPTPIYPYIWFVITGLVAVGAVVIGLFCSFGLIRRESNLSFKSHKPLLIFVALAFFFAVIFEIVFSHIQEGGLFDRHILTAAFPLLFMISLISSANERFAIDKLKRTASVAAACILAGFAAFSIAATHDYLEWNRLRWDLGRSLIERGINPLSIDGGFEFNGWYNYDTFLKRSNAMPARSWWYDRRDYQITMNPQKSYQILQTRSYFSWIHQRPISLFVVKP